MAKSTKSGKSTAKKSSAKKSAKVLKKKAAKSSIKSVKKKETMSRKKAKKALVKKSTKKIIAKKTSAPKKIISKKTKIVTKPKAAKTEKAVEQPKIKLEDIKGYSKKDLDHFKQIILEKRDEIIEQLQNLKDQMLDPTTGEYINENSPYSLHMAEQGTDAMEREKTFLYAQRENKFLGYLEDALKRIEAGTYGICIECIEEPQHLCDTCPLVPKARLEAVPHSQLCLPMKQRQEKK
ncbi:MAG TPA: conjugal transfer protein TraR [Ignavibacteriaceae bacterium]